MAYELYRKIKSKEEYYSSWTDDKLVNLTEDLKQLIYDRYINKCKIFQRDSFKCQNTKCISPNSPLTLHHIKFRKNNGEDKVRNGVTLCRACHMAYHKTKRNLVFGSGMYLPSHIRGHTFRVHTEERLDWKTIKFEMAKMRKSLKSEHGINLSWKQIAILMRFLTVPYDEWDD